MFRLAIGLATIFTSISCLADLQPLSTAQICTVLNDTQLRAGEWTTYQDGHEGCTSGTRLIKTNASDGNKISYSAEGGSGVASRVKVILNVLLPSDEDGAKRELIRATKRLSVRALGLSIPHSFDEAIMKGSPLTLEVGSGKAVLTRTAIGRQSYVLSVVME